MPTRGYASVVQSKIMSISSDGTAAKFASKFLLAVEIGLMMKHYRPIGQFFGVTVYIYI